MSFPTLFPDGKGDPTNNALLRDTSDSITDAFASKLKHLIKFGEKIDGKWVYRFASHPRFGYWAYNMLYRRRILGQGSYFLKQNPAEAKLSIEDLRQMLQSNSYDTLMSKLMHYAKNVSGTNAYWNQARENLKAIINQKGVPTIFWTLSCADFHWPEFHTLFDVDRQLSDSERRENVINNPHLLDWLFTERTEAFVKYWLKETLGAKWHWFRYEYAVQRGSIHCHGVAKLESDPNLCDLSQTALKGHLAAKSMAKNSPNLSTEELLKNQQLIKEGQEAEKTICNYVDFLMSTENPCNPDDGNWVKPNTHPCKKKFEDIDKKEWNKDYEDLLNSVQRHTHCSTAYCLRRTGTDKTYSCRFNYPKDFCAKTCLEYEEIRAKDGTLHHRVKVVTKRNDTRLNNHQRLQLQGWRANCDIQVIIDYHSCIEYIAKYASKSEKMSSVVREAFTSVLHETSNDNDSARVIKKLMMRAIGQRDMSVQEVMHQLLSTKLVSSSFQIVTASLDGSRKIQLQNDVLYTEMSLLDLYARRNMYESDFPGISSLNFLEFASNFFKGKAGINKRNSPVVVKTYPTYSSNPKGPYYGLFCKYQLLKFKPWHNTFATAWDNQEGSEQVYVEAWHSFLTTTRAQNLVPNWLHQLDLISQYFNEIDKEEHADENETGEREEWMYLANLYLENKSPSNEASPFPKGFWERDASKYSMQEIGEMPHWINDQKSSFNLERRQKKQIVDIDTLNHAQHIAYDIVKDHFLHGNDKPLLMIITGLAGSGKSYVIDAIKCLLEQQCRICSFFGIAAFNVSGTTLHSLLQLPIRGKRNGPLKSSALMRLQQNLNGVKYLIIDEFSVIGQKTFAWINRRCKEATGLTTIPFGGISIILVGDVAQLPPITDQVLYHNKPRSDLAVEGYCMYRKFDTVVKLEINERAKGNNEEQEKFRQLQMRARNGDFTVDDWELLLTRQPNRIQNLEHFHNSCARLSYGNEKVATDNFNRLKELNEPIVQINAQHSNSQAKHLSPDDFGGLQPVIYLSKGARVMLTRNLWTEVGLCNGAIGTVIDIIYAPGHEPPVLPIAIMVQFDENDYSGPSFSDLMPNCVPICPVLNCSDTHGSSMERQQFPLKLAWSMTIHKAQGLTLKNTWIDLGPSEKAAGLTYVALTRARTLSNLVIEPMTFERLKAVQKNSNYKYRILEEKRLDQLAQDTLLKRNNTDV